MWRHSPHHDRLAVPPESDIMPSHPRSPARSSMKLPAGVLGRDYLKFLQLSVGDELASEGLFADAALHAAQPLPVLTGPRNSKLRAASSTVMINNCTAAISMAIAEASE